jgi:hypothetical protein
LRDGFFYVSGGQESGKYRNHQDFGVCALQFTPEYEAAIIRSGNVVEWTFNFQKFPTVHRKYSGRKEKIDRVIRAESFITTTISMPTFAFSYEFFMFFLETGQTSPDAWPLLING